MITPITWILSRNLTFTNHTIPLDYSKYSNCQSRSTGLDSIENFVSSLSYFLGFSKKKDQKY